METFGNFKKETLKRHFLSFPFSVAFAFLEVLKKPVKRKV